MTKIQRTAMVSYAILQAKYIRTKHAVYISGYGSSNLDNIIVNIVESISDDDKIFWRL